MTLRRTATTKSPTSNCPTTTHPARATALNTKTSKRWKGRTPPVPFPVWPHLHLQLSLWMMSSLSFCRLTLKEKSPTRFLRLARATISASTIPPALCWSSAKTFLIILILSKQHISKTICQIDLGRIVRKCKCYGAIFGTTTQQHLLREVVITVQQNSKTPLHIHTKKEKTPSSYRSKTLNTAL